MSMRTDQSGHMKLVTSGITDQVTALLTVRDVPSRQICAQVNISNRPLKGSDSCYLCRCRAMHTSLARDKSDSWHPGVELEGAKFT